MLLGSPLLPQLPLSLALLPLKKPQSTFLWVPGPVMVTPLPCHLLYEAFSQISPDPSPVLRGRTPLGRAHHCFTGVQDFTVF